MGALGSDANLPKSIIVGTDGSETATIAVQRAAAFATAFGAKLTIVCAYRIEARGEGLVAGAIADRTWLEAVAAAARDVAERALDLAREAGVKEAAAQAIGGNPANVLIDQAQELSADMIVVGSRGIGSMTRFVLGNVPSKVVHNAPCDVLIVETST